MSRPPDTRRADPISKSAELGTLGVGLPTDGLLSIKPIKKHLVKPII